MHSYSRQVVLSHSAESHHDLYLVLVDVAWQINASHSLVLRNMLHILMLQDGGNTPSNTMKQTMYIYI